MCHEHARHAGRRHRQETCLIGAEDVRIRFGEVEAVGGVSLGIRSGEFVTLLGPSGCGKSSLLKAIAGLVPVAGGTRSVAGQPAGPAAALEVGLMFQKPLLLPWRTTLQNVELPMEIALKSSSGVGRFERARAMELLRMVALVDFAAAYPHQLSGGMQQRAALARTLMSDPDILLLDEPFGALDEFTRESLNEQLLAIWHSGTTRLKAIVMVTHSIPEAVAIVGSHRGAWPAAGARARGHRSEAAASARSGRRRVRPRAGRRARRRQAGRRQADRRKAKLGRAAP